MTKYNTAKHDLVIIGGGPGGYAAALYGAASGMDVALVEKKKLGGACLHVGCIPAKALLETASVFRTVTESAVFGVHASQPTLKWPKVMKRKQQVIDRLAAGLLSLLGSRKVTIYNGSGSLLNANTVKVSADAADGTPADGTPADDTSDAASSDVNGSSGVNGVTSITIESAAVILATGSAPRTIPGFEVDGKLVVTSDELLSMSELPESAVVIGGGAIGCEFASMMSDLGVNVTILEAMPDLLGGCDRDITKVVKRSFAKRGITIRTGVKVNGHKPHAALADGEGDSDSGSTDTDGVTAGGVASDGATAGTSVAYGDNSEVDAQLVVIAVGRKPVTEGLELEAAGVSVDERGFVEVDAMCRTSLAGVWAVGDVINTPQLAHTAFAEGMLAIKDILGEDPVPLNYQGTPWCIYCHPEVAFAGHTEVSAVAQGFDVVTSIHRHAGNGRALIVGETDGVVKIIAEKNEDGNGGRILGVHMAGPWVTEQLGQGYLAVNWEATAEDVASLIQPHPTMSELFGETALSLTGRALHG